jgi:Poly(R)-hydroxyalkanoic acid synthase subunit (PHA_synth_III_E)
VNASSAWRRESSAGVEQWAKLFDLPTRSEINSLTERLRAVETELLRQRAKPSARGAKPRKAKGERKP